jgi:hypothetical protein
MARRDHRRVFDLGRDDVIAMVTQSEKAPLMAWLFDSVPPLVKTTSSEWQPINPEILVRACSTASFAGTPAQ